jgi:hypothetical protein
MPGHAAVLVAEDAVNSLYTRIWSRRNDVAREEAATVDIIVLPAVGTALRHFYDVLSCVTFIGS